jgi:pullulanase
MGAPSDDKEVFVGEEQLLVSGSNDNLTMTFPTTGEYTFIFDASNLNEPTLTVYSAQMFGDTTVFIRGGMNGWGENDALVYQGNGVYSVDLTLDATSYEFKVASGDWATFNLGANSNSNEVVVDSAYQLVQGSNDNLSLSISEAGDYTFTVVGPNPETAKITVTKK